MVYAGAAKKAASFVLLSMVLSLALLTFLSGSVDAPTGHVTAGPAPEASSATLLVFLLGVFIGALVVGTCVYIVHLEAKRKE